MRKKDFNGSTELFAKAFRAMVDDAFEKAQPSIREIVRNELGEIKSCVNGLRQSLFVMEQRAVERNDATNKNMQVQFVRREALLLELKEQMSSVGKLKDV